MSVLSALILPFAFLAASFGADEKADARHNVIIKDGELVIEQLGVIGTERFSDVPEGISAEQAYSLIIGKVKEVEIVDSQKSVVKRLFPFTMLHVQEKRIISFYAGKWGEAREQEEVPGGLFFSLFSTVALFFCVPASIMIITGRAMDFGISNIGFPLIIFYLNIVLAPALCFVASPSIFALLPLLFSSTITSAISVFYAHNGDTENIIFGAVSTVLIYGISGAVALFSETPVYHLMIVFFGLLFCVSSSFFWYYVSRRRMND